MLHRQTASMSTKLTDTSRKRRRRAGPERRPAGVAGRSWWCLGDQNGRRRSPVISLPARMSSSVTDALSAGGLCRCDRLAQGSPIKPIPTSHMAPPPRPDQADGQAATPLRISMFRVDDDCCPRYASGLCFVNDDPQPWHDFLEPPGRPPSRRSARSPARPLRPLRWRP